MQNIIDVVFHIMCFHVEREKNSYDPKKTRYFSFVDFANYFCERENFCVSFSLIFILNSFGQVNYSFIPTLSKLTRNF